MAKLQIAISKLLVSFVLVGAILITALINPISSVYAAANTNNPVALDNNESLRAVGNQVFTVDGQLYIPEGISVFGGLEDTKYTENIQNDDAQIIAAANYWHANTIRLQIAESNLFSNITIGKTYNNKFLQAIIDQVNLAQSLNMAVVLNDQTEFTSKTLGPTSLTVKFWKVMSQTFKNQPYVIFDLFNEPRVEGIISTHRQTKTSTQLMPLEYPLNTRRVQSATKISAAMTWTLWKNGGTVSGVTFIGIQTLVNQIRSYGVNNLIWVEGPNEAKELPSGNYLISGGNIVYSIHHPNLNNPSSWNQIGNLSKIAPVVDGEWAQYQSPWAECYDKAYTNAPLYLNYLLNHNVGVIAWSLQAGSLLQGSKHTIPTNTNTLNDPKYADELKTPSKLLPSYSCNNRFNQGVGQLLQTFFVQNSSKDSPYSTQ